MKFRMSLLAVTVVLTILTVGCRYYSFTGAVPSNLTTVAIPTFENQTAEFGLDQALTDAVVNTFTVDNTLKIVDVRDAESVLYGTIVRVDDQPSTFSADESVQEYKVTIVVKVRYEDLTKGKVVWEQNLSNFGIYPFTGDQSAREEGVDDALRKLTEDILNKTVSGW